MNAQYRRRAFRLGLFTVTLAALIALCVFSGHEALTQVSTPPLDFPHVVIFATNSVRLQNSAQVVAGHVVVNTASAGPTLSDGTPNPIELGVGPGVLTPAGASVVADSISIARGAIVNGNVWCNGLTNQGTINGTPSTCTPGSLTLPVFSALPAFQSASPGAQDVTVVKNTVQTLAPGAYRDIKVQSGATLNFSPPGLYNLRSLSLDSTSKLLFKLSSASDRTEVRVQNQVTTAAGCVVGPADADPTKAAQIVFYVAFPTPSGALTPAAATIGNGNTLFANVYAPNGTLVLGNGTRATGAFFAKDVDVGNTVRLDLETFFSAPAITSANNTAFTVGQAGTFTVTTTGVPAPTVTRGGVALPSGVTFVDNGNGTGTLSGTPAAGTAGTYALTFTASNGVTPNATQNFTLTVKQAPAITSANATTFTVGTAGTFTVTTTGSPTVTTLTETGTLPSGVTFVNNGNGTGTLSGTPAAGTAGTYALTFTASNGTPPNATQSFTLSAVCPVITVNPAGPALAAGTVGMAYSQTFTATGGTGPYSFAVTSGALPGGLTLGSGGGLSGSPTNSGNFSFTVSATDASLCTGAHSYTLLVQTTPAPNVPPIANAGQDQTILLLLFSPTTVTLDGSGSADPDHGPGPLTFSWAFAAQPSFSNATLANATTAQPSFIPDQLGTYRVTLTVSDGAATAQDDVLITVQRNALPNAITGADVFVQLGQTATLDGTQSYDPDGGPSPLTFRWFFASTPAGSRLTNSDITDATMATAHFTPDVEGSYVLTLAVSDGGDYEAFDQARVVASTAAESVCYSISNAQGWTATQSGLPPSLALGSGNTYSQWRFNVVCDRGTGLCKRFGKGSQVLLDYDGPNGPQGEFEQSQFYCDFPNPSSPPTVTTQVGFGSAESLYSFNLRLGGNDETFAMDFRLTWLDGQNGPPAGNNAPTFEEIGLAEAASWERYSHVIHDDFNPLTNECSGNGVRGTPPVGPVWVAPGHPRCHTALGFSPCCTGSLTNGFSTGIPTQVFRVTKCALSSFPTSTCPD